MTVSDGNARAPVFDLHEKSNTFAAEITGRHQRASLQRFVKMDARLYGATPLTLAQEFGAWRAQLDRPAELSKQVRVLYASRLGGRGGHGINAHVLRR